MAYQDDGSCIMFSDKRLKEKDANPKWPPLTGFGDIGGKSYWVSAYVNEANADHGLVKKGTIAEGEKYFSISFRERDQKPPQTTAPTATEEIPFI